MAGTQMSLTRAGSVVVLTKLKIQFDKAAVESKKNITKLTEENTKSAALIEELKTDLEKKQVECRTLNTKLTSMEKEFNRYNHGRYILWSKRFEP